MYTIFLTGCSKNQSQIMEPPEFENVSVHDPSIIQANESYYVIGSHLQAAKSKNLMQWEQISESVPLNTLFEDVYAEFREEFGYAKTDTFWAGDIQQLKDGRYYLYYCLCKGDEPLSVLGVAVADNIEGPYKKIESFLYSGTSPQFGENYDATKHPNAIDPHVFYDNEGKLWMVYGSYSGGIFILEMDENTGLPIDRTSYGKRLMGGNHSRIEAPYIIYNPETEYYYLFVSFGGLDSFGGYNMRVSRSKQPDGPYEDISGNQMQNAKGQPKTYFDDISIEKYGNKLMGNFTYEKNDGLTNNGYVSAGHNSVFYDDEKNQYYLIFHTRFPNGGEMHELRVHELYFTDEGWPIVNPLRYSDTTSILSNEKSIIKNYSLIKTTKDIIDWIEEPDFVSLNKNGAIEGDVEGNWKINSEQKNAKIELNKTVYEGKFLLTWDENQEAMVNVFTGVSKDGVPVYLVEEKRKK